MRPSSREAADGLAQAEQGAKLEQIALAEVRALAFERRELWEQAIELYRGVLATRRAPCCSRRRGSSEREVRAGLDAKLSNLIDNPTLLFGDTVLADAREVARDAAAREPRQGRASRHRSSSSVGSSSSPRRRSPCGSNRMS